MEFWALNLVSCMQPLLAVLSLYLSMFNFIRNFQIILVNCQYTYQYCIIIPITSYLYQYLTVNDLSFQPYWWILYDLKYVFFSFNLLGKGVLNMMLEEPQSTRGQSWDSSMQNLCSSPLRHHIVQMFILFGLIIPLGRYFPKVIILNPQKINWYTHYMLCTFLWHKL